jgi:hypothetical protein
MDLLSDESRDRSVGIATDYELNGPGLIPTLKDFSLVHSVQTDSGAHWGVKAAGAWSIPLPPSVEVKKGGAILPLLYTSSWNSA